MIDYIGVMANALDESVTNLNSTVNATGFFNFAQNYFQTMDSVLASSSPQAVEWYLYTDVMWKLSDLAPVLCCYLCV